MARVSLTQDGNVKLSLSSLFLHNAIIISSVFSFPRILFKSYSQILVVFTFLTYTTTSWTCSLWTIHAASRCSYSIRSNLCCYVDLLKHTSCHIMPQARHLQWHSEAKQSPNFLFYHSIAAYFRNQYMCVFFTYILMNYYYFQ